MIAVFHYDQQENEMKNFKAMLTLVGTICALLFCGPSARSQATTDQVHVVITDATFRMDTELPPLQKDDVRVRQGKNNLDITQLIAAQGENDALQLMILIDDTLDGGAVGNNLSDIKDFINAQPKSALIGVAYMSNAGIQITQNFTADHDLAAKAIRLPLGRLSTMDSPYLSLMALVRGWPQQKVRREVLMVADGIDRLRGERPQSPGPSSSMGSSPMGSSRMSPNRGPVSHSMPTISIDADSASENSQRNNVIVFSIYSPGVGRAGRSSWDMQIGLSGLTKIADETGGECFGLGTSVLVSFKPYLDRLSKYLNNQYYLVFNAPQGNRDRLLRVNIQKVEGKNSEIMSPDNVWVPGVPKDSK
jgi:hypothetical protein